MSALSGNFIKRVGILLGSVGIVLAIYAEFIFDPTISPLDLAPRYGNLEETGSYAERAEAVSDIAGRMRRAMAGERIVSIALVAEQQRLFYLGLFLIVGGGGLIAFGVHQANAEAESSDEEFL